MNDKGERNMNKPLTMIVNDTKAKLTAVCNESGLPPVILDLIVENLYSEIHSIVNKQTMDEEKAYMESLKDEVISDDKDE